MLYSEKVMDHFRNPRNVGEIENADGVGEVGNAKCGDIMKMYLKIDDGIICDVKFETFGCGSAIATSSIATETINGKPVEEALQLFTEAVVEAVDGLPAYKLHCSVLAEVAVTVFAAMTVPASRVWAVPALESTMRCVTTGWSFRKTRRLYDAISCMVGSLQGRDAVDG